MRKIDLNLFRVFDAVMQHRSVIAASRDLHVTPSAVSHALARLRQSMNDELFIAGEAGMEPTPRALQLAPCVRNGLDAFASAVAATDFHPDRAIRSFRLAASDYACQVLLPALVDRLARLAPQIDLRVQSAGRVDVIRQLDEGKVDVVLGWFKEVPERLRRLKIADDVESLLVRADHPLTQLEVTMEGLAEFPHVVVELTGTEGQAVDGFFDERGVVRRVWIERLLLEMSAREDGLIGRVAASVPHYMMVPPLLLRSDMVATLPRRLAATVAADLPLVMLEPPGGVLRATLEALWHLRAEQDAGNRWLFAQLGEVARELAG